MINVLHGNFNWNTFPVCMLLTTPVTSVLVVKGDRNVCLNHYYWHSLRKVPKENGYPVSLQSFSRLLY